MLSNSGQKYPMVCRKVIQHYSTEKMIPFNNHLMSQTSYSNFPIFLYCPNVLNLFINFPKISRTSVYFTKAAIVATLNPQCHTAYYNCYDV